jgi:NAD-dependent dihydropyrimidine dehydrogenase PreA subunit
MNLLLFVVKVAVFKGDDSMAVKVDEEKCVGCGSCESVCLVDAIKMEAGKAKISDNCIECGACISECPVEAISI